MYIMYHKKCIQSLDSASFCSIGFMWIMQLKKTTSKAIAWNRYFYFLEYLISLNIYILPLFMSNHLFDIYIKNINNWKKIATNIFGQAIIA